MLHCWPGAQYSSIAYPHEVLLASVGKPQTACASTEVLCEESIPEAQRSPVQHACFLVAHLSVAAASSDGEDHVAPRPQHANETADRI